MKIPFRWMLAGTFALSMAPVFAQQFPTKSIRFIVAFPPAVTSGEIHLVIDGHTNYVPFVKEGKLRAIGLVSPGKDALLPDVPNVREQGFAELERLGWWALFGPANLPGPVLSRLSNAALWTLKQPDFLEKQAALGLTPRPGTPEELAAQVKADIARWTPIIKAAGIKLD